MQQVLRRMTSAASGSSVGCMPSATRSAARRSESCSFIWHPKVRTWNRRGMSARVYGPGLSGSPGVHVGLVAFLVAATAVSIGSVVQGAVGFGLNLLAAPFVALVIPAALPATMVLVAFPLAVSTVVREHHAVEWPALRWMLLGAVPGTLLGLAIVGEVDPSQLAAVVGSVTLPGAWPGDGGARRCWPSRRSPVSRPSPGPSCEPSLDATGAGAEAPAPVRAWAGQWAEWLRLDFDLFLLLGLLRGAVALRGPVALPGGGAPRAAAPRPRVRAEPRRGRP